LGQNDILLRRSLRISLARSWIWIRSTPIRAVTAAGRATCRRCGSQSRNYRVVGGGHRC